MIKFFLSLIGTIVLSLGCLSSSFAQDSDTDTGTEELTPVKSIIKLAPFQFVDNTFFLSYESFNQDFTKSFNVGLGFKTASDFNEEELGFKYEVQYRFYVNGFKPYTPKRKEASYRRGIYASVYFSGLYTQIESEFSTFDPVGNFSTFRTNERTINAFNPGVTIGIQRSVWDILYLDFYVGGGVRFASVRDSDDLFPDNRFEFQDIYDTDYEGVFPKIGINVGIGF
ncbi:MAG: hypothetical protein AAFQ94_18015 [Bacteroidota bacterium]